MLNTVIYKGEHMIHSLHASRLPRTVVARALVATLIATVAALGSVVATSGTAHAATTRCTQAEMASYTSKDYTVLVPAYVSGGNFNRNCYLNYRLSRDYATNALQITLNNCYADEVRSVTKDEELLELDGVYGTYTKKAVIAVQKKLGLTADGVYGPNTRNKMAWDIEELVPCVRYGAF